MRSDEVRRWSSEHPGPTRELREVVEARHYDALYDENSELKKDLTELMEIKEMYATEISKLREQNDKLNDLLTEAAQAFSKLNQGGSR